MSGLTVDQLLAADSSSDDEVTDLSPPAHAGASSYASGAAPIDKGGEEGARTGTSWDELANEDVSQAKPPRQVGTLEEALAEEDLSDEDFPVELPSQAAPADQVRAAGEVQLGDASDSRGDDTRGKSPMDLDALLGMDSDSSEEGPRPAARPQTSAAQPSTDLAGKGATETSDAQEPEASAETWDVETEAFRKSPFAWCLEHERQLVLHNIEEDPALIANLDQNPDSRADQVPGGTDSASFAMAETKPCLELQRKLDQELGLPTCVFSNSSKFVGLGTLRGAVILLDPKAQDADPKAPVLSLPGNEDGAAVSAAAFSPDGSSMLVGHKNGHLILWDLATNRATTEAKDIHTCPVLSVAFCRPSWQYSLSADAKGNVFFLTFTSTFGRRDCTRQLLLEQSSNIGIVLRILPLQQVPNQVSHPADAHCLVALCATNATVLLTLHPSAQVLQKMQYHTKETTRNAWVPDAAWLRLEVQNWMDATQPQLSDPQLCIAFGQSIHIMRVSVSFDQVNQKEEFKIALLHRYTWGSPINCIVAFCNSVLAIFDAADKLNVVQLPSPPSTSDTKSAASEAQAQQQQLVCVHSVDVADWSLLYHSHSHVDGSMDLRSHHGAFAVFKGKGRGLYVCGMKGVRNLKINRWGQHIEELVGKNHWDTALDVFVKLHKGTLPSLLDFPHTASARQKAVDARSTQVIQSYLVSSLQPDTGRAQVKRMCVMTVHACIEMKLWSVLYKTVFECFKAAGHSSVYCNTLEPFIVKGRIPRGQMDSEVLSSILQSYALPLEEEEQAAEQHFKSESAQGNASAAPLLIDCDHCARLFTMARRLQQLVLYVDVSQLDLNLAIRLFTKHRLWTALVYVYCALADYTSPLELLAGECTQLAKKCIARTDGGTPEQEAPLLQCLLVRKLFFFLQRCFENRAFPLDEKELPGTIHPSPGAAGDLLQCIFKPDATEAQAPPMFLRLLRLSPLGLFSAFAVLFTSPAASHKIEADAQASMGSHPLALSGLFQKIEEAMCASRRQAEDGLALPPGTEGEFLWFVAQAAPRARLELRPRSRSDVPRGPQPQNGAVAVSVSLEQVVEHLLSSRQNTSLQPFSTWHTPEEAQRLLIGVLAAQETLSEVLRNHFISRAMQQGFFGAASWLHEQQGDYGKVLNCRLEDPDLRENIFEYIVTVLGENPTGSRTALVEATLQRLPRLVGIDPERCATMICEQFSSVADHGSVLDRLRGHSQIEMQYLETLLVRRRGWHWKSQEEQQAFVDNHVVRYVELLCSRTPGAVLPFIQGNETLPLRECLELCRKFEVTDASVHLLERTGDFVAVLELLLSDYDKALEQLRLGFLEAQGQHSRTVIARMLKRLTASADRPPQGQGLAREEVMHTEAPWWEGFKEAERCVDLLEHAFEMSSRNSNIMTDGQLEELWFGVLRRTVHQQEEAAREKNSRRHAGLAAALAELASRAMKGVLAYLSLPVSLKWICDEFGSSTLGLWKDHLQRMLSGLSFQQGLLVAARAVSAQDVVKPFEALKRRGSRGVRLAAGQTTY